MAQPLPSDREAFRAFLADHTELQAETEFAAFLAGGWVRHAGQWARRTDHVEKRNPKMNYPSGHPYAT